MSAKHLSFRRIAGPLARRVRNHRLLGPAAARIEDLAANTAFWLNPASSRRTLARLAHASPDEVFVLSWQVFGSIQNRSEILALAHRLGVDHPRTFCEIGTAGGGTNFLLARLLPELDCVLGVDLFVRAKPRLRYYARAKNGLRFFDGSSRDPATIAAVGRALAGRELDVLFIDGDHSYAGVRADFLGYRGFVRDGGTIVFHDICQDFETRHGRKTMNCSGDVPEFWRKLKTAYPHEEFIDHPDQDGLGIGLLRYSKSAPLPPGL